MTAYNESAGGQPAGPTGRLKLTGAGRPPAKTTDTTEQKGKKAIRRVASVRTRTSKKPPVKKLTTFVPFKSEKNTFGPHQ